MELSKAELLQIGIALVDRRDKLQGWIDDDKAAGVETSVTVIASLEVVLSALQKVNHA